MKAQQKLKRVVALARDILKDAATGTLDGEAQAIYTATLDAYDRGRGRPAKFKTLVHKWRRAGVPLGGLAQLTLGGRLPGRARKTTPQELHRAVCVHGV